MIHRVLDDSEVAAVLAVAQGVRIRLPPWPLLAFGNAKGATSRYACSCTNRRCVMSFIWFLLVGLAAGWLAGVLVKGGGFGLVGDLVVGVVGALIGGFIFGMLGVSAGGGLLGSLLVATLGAVVLLFIVRLIKRG